VILECVTRKVLYTLNVGGGPPTMKTGTIYLSKIVSNKGHVNFFMDLLLEYDQQKKEE